MSFILATPRSLQDLSSPTRDQTRSPEAEFKALGLLLNAFQTRGLETLNCQPRSCTFHLRDKLEQHALRLRNDQALTR